MKAMIVYATALGNSKKIAEAIGAQLKTEVHNVSGISAPKMADTIIIVGGIYGGKSKKELKEFVKMLDSDKVKNVAVITSSGAGERRTIPSEIVELIRGRKINILGELNVRGRAFIFPTGHPNETDLKMATEWVVKITKS